MMDSPDFRFLDGTRAVTRSESMRKLFAMAQRVAQSSGTVLIVGETGTGKELIARSIHHFSLRCNKPLVDVNCAALPEHLVESELFGYEKGAFSGAETLKPGLFEMADKSTLFLDEIGELDAKIQVKLLRVLDGVPYYRLGGNRKVSVDVRIVAATNRPMEEAVEKGHFRRDLYHRLNHFVLHVPPLRERPEDIEALATCFLQNYKPKARFSAGALDQLRGYHWPGNVRELRNFVSKLAVVLEDGHDEIQASDLPREWPSAAQGGDSQKDLNSMERQMIEQALERNSGNRTLAAGQLGISRRTLIRRLAAYQNQPEAAAAKMAVDKRPDFRVRLETMAILKNGTGEFVAKTTNISAVGIAIQSEQPIHHSGSVEVCFRLPDVPEEIQTQGEIVWADSQGAAGIRFNAMDSNSQQALKRWLASQQQDANSLYAK
jgi:transcriptional regulator with PAS, ATPase and Fis domain